MLTVEVYGEQRDTGQDTGLCADFQTMIMTSSLIQYVLTRIGILSRAIPHSQQPVRHSYDISPHFLMV